MSTPSVNIISVNYNSASDILHCLESLKNASFQEYQLFIVDNLSTDNSISEIQNGVRALGLTVYTLSSENLYDDNAQTQIKGAKVILIENVMNSGYGAGNNVAIKYLIEKREDNEFIWLLNPDVEVEVNVMQDLVNLQQGKIKTITGNLIHYFSDRDEVMYRGGFKVNKFIHGITNITTAQRVSEIDAIAGAALFTDVATFKDLGVLPEAYFLYWEETDFCTKAKRAGYSFEVNTQSIIYDRVGSSANTNFTREYLYILNGLRYYRKFYTWHLPFILLSTFAKQIKALLFSSRIKRRAVYFGHIDFFRLLFGLNVDMKKRIKNQ